MVLLLRDSTILYVPPEQVKRFCNISHLKMQNLMKHPNISCIRNRFLKYYSTQILKTANFWSVKKLEKGRGFPMKNTGSSGGKRLLLAFLALYLILTLAPAAIYGAGHVDALSPSDSPQTPVEKESAPSTASSSSSALGPAPDFLQGQRLPGNTAQGPDTFTLTENNTGEIGRAHV